MPRRVRYLALLAAAIVARASLVHADDVTQPRAVGRAGVGIVSDDGVGAVMSSPAGLARRSTPRAQLGGTLVDDTLSDSRTGTRSGNTSGPARLQGSVGIALPVGPLVVGAAVSRSDSGRTLPAPTTLTSLENIARDYQYRYAGLSARRDRDAVGVGAAFRANDWLAVGASATLARIHVEERRRVWAGFSGRDPIGNPSRDLELTLRGTDNLVPGAAFSVLVAPIQVPVEFAVAVVLENHARVAASPSLRADPAELTIRSTTSGASLSLEAPLQLRAGIRWLSERWTAEVGVDAWLLSSSAASPEWAITGVELIDRVGATTQLTELSSRFAKQTHATARAAVDVEVLPRLLWATAGYAFAQPATAPGAAAATTAELGGHTAAIGLEGNAAGITITLGWSLTWSSRAQPTSLLGYDDPFAPAVGDVGISQLAGTRNQVSLSVEVEFL